MSNFRCAVVNIRGSALPSAEKSKEEPLLVQSVCLCACNQWAYAVDQLFLDTVHRQKKMDRQMDGWMLTNA